MAQLKVPSAQHLARNWRPQAQSIKRLLVELANNSPTFNYDLLFSAVRDLLVLRVPYDQVEAGIKRVRRKDLRENLLGVLPLIRDHFDGIEPSFFQSVARRYYPVGRELMVPFDPPLIYGIGGQIYFPWFSFWRSNPLRDERLSLFVSIVDDVLLQDPDLEAAKFEILDFSAPEPKMPRVLTVTDAAWIPRVTPERKAEMLSMFAEGFSMAKAELVGSARAEREPMPASQDKTEQERDPDLFDNDR